MILSPDPALCPDTFPSGSVDLTLSVPEGDLEIVFWRKEQLYGQTRESSCLSKRTEIIRFGKESPDDSQHGQLSGRVAHF